MFTAHSQGAAYEWEGGIQPGFRNWMQILNEELGHFNLKEFNVGLNQLGDLLVLWLEQVAFQGHHGCYPP